MTVAGFDWDEGNRCKCQKHGVSIEAIEAMFQQTVSVVPDPGHSHNEEGFKAIGRDHMRAAIFCQFSPFDCGMKGASSVL